MKPALSLALLCLVAIVAGLSLWPRDESRTEMSTRPKQAAVLASPAAVTPEQLMKEVETVRGLNFQRPPVFVPVSAAELEKAIRAAWEREFPPAAAESRVRTAMALGLTRETFDLGASLTGMALEQPVACYEKESNRLVYDRDINLAARPDLRARLVFEIARALVQQNTKVPPPANTGDDAFLAAENVIQGDAMITQTRHSLSFPANLTIIEPAPPIDQYYAAPPFLRTWYLFPAGMAQVFQTGLLEAAPAGKGMAAVLHRILAKPPRTTAEIMHPELYASDAFVPELVVLPSVEVQGLRPLADNTLGEFVTLLVLKSQLTQDQSHTAAAGWCGDRCLVFSGSGSGENRDHLLWKSRWVTVQDAQEFLTAIRKVLLFRNALLPDPSYEAPRGAFRVDAPTVSLRAALTPDSRGVVVISSPDKMFAAALEHTQRMSGLEGG